MDMMIFLVMGLTRMDGLMKMGEEEVRSVEEDHRKEEEGERLDLIVPPDDPITNQCMSCQRLCRLN